MLQHGDGRAIGVPVRKAPLKPGRAILAQQINPLTQKTPKEGAEQCLSNYRGSLYLGALFWHSLHGLAVSDERHLAACSVLPHCSSANKYVRS